MNKWTSGNVFTLQNQQGCLGSSWAWDPLAWCGHPQFAGRPWTRWSAPPDVSLGVIQHCPDRSPTRRVEEGISRGPTSLYPFHNHIYLNANLEIAPQKQSGMFTLLFSPGTCWLMYMTGTPAWHGYCTLIPEPKNKWNSTSRVAKDRNLSLHS